LIELVQIKSITKERAKRSIRTKESKEMANQHGLFCVCVFVTSAAVRGAARPQETKYTGCFLLLHDEGLLVLSSQPKKTK
jgi:hypothetical protein